MKDVDVNPDVKAALGGDGESLEMFKRGVIKFHKRFCEEMHGNTDFTLKLEVRGNKGKLLHCKGDIIDFERPAGVEKEVIEAQKRQRQGKW